VDSAPVGVVRLGVVEYGHAWALQEALLEARAAGRLTRDWLLLLEHPSVVTLGRRARPEHLLDLRDSDGSEIPTFAINRGGDVTWHGPGQLVGYPIFDLGPLGGDVIRYLRLLEETVIAACRALGVEAGRNPPMTGVWCRGDKVASLGVGVRRNVAMHGFALNVDPDMSAFERIVPCGLHGVRMTSLARLRGGPVAMGEALDATERAFAEVFGRVVERREPGEVLRFAP
jgi:lipoate-protein ligase B